MERNYLVSLLFSVLSVSASFVWADTIDEFDYYHAETNLSLAQAEYQRGNLTEAVFALERVLAIDPANEIAKATLARVYMDLKEYRLAKNIYHDLILLGSEFSPEARAGLRKIRVRERLSHRGVLGFELTYDNNILSVTEDTQIFVPAFNQTVDLSADHSKKEGTRNRFYGGGILNYRLNNQVGISGRGLVSEARDGELNQRLMSAGLGVSYGRGQELAQFSIDYLALDADGVDGMQDFGTKLSLSRAWGNQRRVSAYTRLNITEYEDQKVKNDRRLWFGGDFSQKVSGKVEAGFGVYKTEDVDRSESFRFLDFNSAGAKVTGAYFMTPVLRFDAVLGFDRVRYLADRADFQKTRKDDRYSLQVKSQLSLGDATRIRVTAAAYHNDSNLTINDYERETIGVSVERFF